MGKLVTPLCFLELAATAVSPTPFIGMCCPAVPRNTMHVATPGLVIRVSACTSLLKSQGDAPGMVFGIRSNYLDDLREFVQVMPWGILHYDTDIIMM